MKPTDEEIRLKVASVLGHKPFYQDYDENHHFPYYIPSGKPRRTHMIDAKPLPDYTRDRNALPELRNAIEKACVMNLFELRLCQSLLEDFAKDDELPIGYMHKLVFAEPRTVAIAALLALDKWPAEWED